MSRQNFWFYNKCWGDTVTLTFVIEPILMRIDSLHPHFTHMFQDSFMVNQYIFFII